MFSKLEKRYFLHNGVAFYNKDILKKYPFNEYLTAKEDRYWAKKIIKNKKKSYTICFRSFSSLYEKWQYLKGIG